MNVVDPGHAYLLNVLDGDKAQPLVFVKRQGPAYPGNENSYPGTNLQEVLRACIDRVKYVDSQLPCDENKLVLGHLRHCIRLLEVRAAMRHGRDVDMFDYRNRTMSTVETMPTCPECGHIGCAGQCESHQPQL